MSPAVQGAGNPPVILVRGRSPKSVRKLKPGGAYPPQVILHPSQGAVRVVPLSKRRGVSVEPVMLRRNGSGSSGKSNESRLQPVPKTPTLSFGDKMAGLRDAGTMKLFGPNKKRSQTSEKDFLLLPPSNSDSALSAVAVQEENQNTSVIPCNSDPLQPQRKNSTDALRTAVLHSKAALKKGLKIGSTGLTGLRKPNSDAGGTTTEKVS